MHTTVIGGFRIHHNGDFSGDVRIELARGTAVIPCWVLLEFAGQAVMSRQVSALEGKSGLEVLGLKDLAEE